MKSLHGIGVDFGTTNSSVAWAADDGSPAVLRRFPSLQGLLSTFRSVLFFDEQQSSSGRIEELALAGPQAIERYLEWGSGRLVQSMKSYLASELFKQTMVQGKAFKLEELIAFLLRRLFSAAGLDTEAWAHSRVVVGRPVRFVRAGAGDDTELPMRRLREAFALAGVHTASFEYEPVGAAWFYEAKLTRDELVLIADFGGGTSDFCLMRVGPEARRRAARHEDVLATAGVGIAGDAFDGRIVDAIVSPRLGRDAFYRSFFHEDRRIPIPSWPYENLRRWHHLSFLKSRKTLQFLRDMLPTAEDPSHLEALLHLVENDLGYQLYRAVEACKLGLSQHPTVEFCFEDGPVAIRRTVARAEFDTWIAPELQRIAVCVDQLFTDHGLSYSSVDRVFLTGGSSLVPSVRELFAQRFGEEKLAGGDELTAVALGLSLRARDRTD